jgi:hypothetical protein
MISIPKLFQYISGIGMVFFLAIHIASWLGYIPDWNIITPMMCIFASVVFVLMLPVYLKQLQEISRTKFSKISSVLFALPMPKIIYFIPVSLRFTSES